MEPRRFSPPSLLARSMALLGGVGALLLSPSFPPALILCALTVITIAAFAASRRLPVLVLAGWFGAGYLLASWHAHHYLKLRWTDDGARVLIDATVESIPELHGDIWLFDVSARIRGPVSEDAKRYLRLVSRDIGTRPRAGERWELLVELRSPRGHINPGTFDEERVLFQERVHALGVVVPSRLNRLISTGHGPLTSARERVVRYIDALIVDRDAAALIAALAVGATGPMSREQWRVFNATGTTHLVAISGLHVTLFAIVAIAVARWLWRSALWRIVKAPRESFAALVGLCAATAYSALAGFSVPTQRTLLMLAAWLLVRSIARAVPPATSIAAALIAVLLLDPFSVLAPGFWLSFGTMAAIIFVTEPRILARSRIGEALAVQAAASLALVPVTLACFGSVSLIGPLVNLVAIPVVSWIFVPVILTATVLLPWASAVSAPLFRFAAYLHGSGWPALRWAADLNGALIHANPPGWWYPLAILGVVILLMPWPWRLRVAVALSVLTLAIGENDRAPEDGHLQVTILDVGQATAVVLRTRHHALMFGTGTGYGSQGGNVDTIVLPFLHSRGIRRLETVIADGGPNSEGAGVTALAAALPAGRVVRSGGCRETERWFRDGVRFEMMRARNGRSCVLRAEAGGQRILVAGQADEEEQRLLALQHDLSADVIVLPRNGSGDNAEPFVDEVSAVYAIVSGRRYTHAGNTRASVRRWKEAGAHVLATADSGAIEMRLGAGAGPLAPREARLARRALWRP